MDPDSETWRSEDPDSETWRKRIRLKDPDSESWRSEDPVDVSGFRYLEK